MTNYSKKTISIHEIGKVPPNDRSLEKAILGALLIDSSSELFENVCSIISEDSFYDSNHKLIFRAIQSINDSFGKVDILTVADELKKRNDLDQIGGEIYLSELTDKVATSAHIIFHCQIVQEKYILREIIVLCHEMSKLAYENNISVDDVIKEFETKIKSLEEKAKKSLSEEDKSSNSFNDLMSSFMSIQTTGINPNILKTGDTEIDKVVDIIAGELIYLVGAHKSFKTKTLIYIMDNLIKRYDDKINVLWYCMEDPAKKIIRNRISMKTGISDMKLQGKRGIITQDDLKLIRSIEKEVNNENVTYVETPTDVDSIYRKFKNFVQKDKHNFLVIDNFNICVSQFKGNYNATATEKENYVSEKIQVLNSYLAEQGYKVTVIVCDHTKKENMSSENLQSGYRPRRDALKGSSRKYDTLTQLVFVHRPGKYKDLVTMEKKNPDIKINGKYYSRKNILASDDGWGLVILERTEARDGDDMSENVISRFYANVDIMTFKHLKNI